MKKSDKILYAILAVLIIAIISYVIIGMQKLSSVETPTINTGNNQDSTTQAFKTITTGTTNAGEVEIALTPHEIKDGQLKIDIAVNTHSVDLSPFDLKEITTLEYDGKTITPEQAPSLNGHHSSGTLVFAVDKEITAFTIKIKGIPKVEERIFQW